jgi:hypothetical protein
VNASAGAVKDERRKTATRAATTIDTNEEEVERSIAFLCTGTN